MGLLSGGGATVLGGIFSSLYLDATVYKQEAVYADDGDVTITYAEYDALAQVDAMTEAMRSEQGASDQDRRIIILSTSTAAPVDSDCEITVNAGPYAGVRFQVASIDRDPCGSYFSCRGRRSGVQA